MKALFVGVFLFLMSFGVSAHEHNHRHPHHHRHHHVWFFWVQPRLEIETGEVFIDRGSTIDITISRDDCAGNAQVGLASSGSNILVSGGFFMHGQRDTIVRIETSKFSREGFVFIRYNNKQIQIKVTFRD